MANIAYVMLAHEQPQHVAEHAGIITSADPAATLMIHYDASVAESRFKELSELVAPLPRVTLVEKRARCGWGEFGLVEGVLFALREIAGQGLNPDYVYLISGSCLPIRPLAELNQFLSDQAGTDYIQSQDASWIKGGLKHERYRFYFPVSFKKRRKLFDLLVKLQRRLRVRRRIPGRLEPRFGSQWWCLTWATCRRILDYLDRNPRFERFFRSTWIPDECFFQTLAYHLSEGSIRDTSLTLHQFTDKGKPILFYDDHEDWVFAQNFFFARKISPEATRLKQRIRSVAADPPGPVRTQNIGRSIPFYEAALWLRARRERPGQLFRADQRRGSYPGAIARGTRPYVVLFGPPSTTRIAARAFRREGCTVFGRLFHPDRVSLHDYGAEAPGLRADDVAIRDFCPSLYLARVIDRASGVPVFEQSIVDNPTAAYLAYDDPNCLFIGCLPRPEMIGRVQDWGDEHWRFLTALYLVEIESAHDPAWAELIETIGDRALWDFEFQRILESDPHRDVISWLRNKGFADLEKPNFLLLPSSIGERARVGTLVHATPGDIGPPVETIANVVAGPGADSELPQKVAKFEEHFAPDIDWSAIENGISEATRALRACSVADLAANAPLRLGERLIRMAAELGISDHPRHAAIHSTSLTLIEPTRRVI